MSQSFFWWPKSFQCHFLLLVDSRFTDAASPYALSFDGANDVVTVADNASLNPTTGDLTITFWVKLDSVVAGFLELPTGMW